MEHALATSVVVGDGPAAPGRRCRRRRGSLVDVAATLLSLLALVAVPTGADLPPPPPGLPPRADVVTDGTLHDSADTSLQRCCYDQKVSAGCIGALCGTNDTAHESGWLLSCFVEVPKVFLCLSGMQDSRSCCLQRGIPSHCSELCGGDVSVLGYHSDCLHRMSGVSQCFHNKYEKLPGPPNAVEITDVTMSTAKISWSPPVYKADKLTSYLVRYKRHQESRSDEVRTADTSCMIQSLVPSTLYEVSVVSVSANGTSWPSPAAVFMTYSYSDEALELSFATSVPDTSGTPTGTQKVPSAPRQLSISSRGTYTLNLSWMPPSDNADHISSYSVYYRPTIAADVWNIRSVESFKTSTILQNLQPDTEYSVKLVAVGVSGNSLPTPIISMWTLPVNVTTKVGSHRDLTDCCMAHNVSSTCIPACSASGIVNLHVCAQDLVSIITCAADDNSQVPCCQRMRIPDHCLGFCNGSASVVSYQSLLCLGFFEQISSCFQEETDLLPVTPANFLLEDIGSSYAVFSWSVSSVNENEITYRLHYGMQLPSGQQGPDNFVENVRSPYKLRSLKSSAHYFAYLVAVSTFGTSWPTTPLSFQTYPEEAGSISIIQTPLGYVTVGSPLILACNHGMLGAEGLRTHVSWIRGSSNVDGQVYRIDRVSPQDTGRYTCIVEYGYEHSQSADTIVRVQFAPTVAPLQQYVRVSPNHTAHLACRFLGYPDSINWYRNDSKMPVIGSRYSVTRYLHEDIGAVDAQLSIENVMRDDYGSYRCEGTNVYSEAATYVDLIDTHTLKVDIEETTPDQTTSLFNFTDCCTKSGVSQRCASACTSHIISSPIDDECTEELSQVLACAADGRDHSRCCTWHEVPGECMALCGGFVSTNPINLLCLAHVEDIIDCMHQGRANIPSQPRDVRLSLTSLGNILVEWDVPETNADMVQFYDVLYVGEISAEVNVSRMTVYGQSAELTNLRRFTMYDVMVIAGNQYGTSLPSLPAHITTLDMVPSAPRQLSAKAIDRLSFVVTWQKPEIHAEFVDAYHVYYAPVLGTEPHSKEIVAAQRLQCSLNHLQPNTRYEVYVTALAGNHESPPSNLTFIHTSDVVESAALAGFFYRHKVALAIGFLLLGVVIIIAALLLRYYYHRLQKCKSRRGQMSSSVSFENPNYSCLAEAQVRFADECTDDEASKPFASAAVPSMNCTT